MTKKTEGNVRVTELYLKLGKQTITDQELNEFNEKISNLVWKTVHNCSVKIPKEDIYQEIWNCIILNAYRFDETKGSGATYIWRICASVIGQYKHNFKLKNNHIAISDFVEKEEQADAFFEKKLSENTKSYVPEKLQIVDDFIDSLEDAMDRKIINLAVRPSEKDLETVNKHKKNKRRKLIRKDIVELLGISFTELETRLEKLSKVFHEKFEKTEFDEVC